MQREITRHNHKASRDEYIIERCKGKNVLHIGACDCPYTEEKFHDGTLLYAKLDAVVKEQIGIDLDASSATFLESQEFSRSRIVVADMNRAQDIGFRPDVIVFGETLEHLTNPGIALDSIKKLMEKDTELIVSVPNALCFANVIGALLGKEYQHPDHKIACTYKTVQQLLEHAGFSVHHTYFTWLPQGTGTLRWRGAVIARMGRIISYLFPQYAGTILMTAGLPSSKEAIKAR